MSKKSLPTIDDITEAAMKLADEMGIIDHDWTEADLEPIKKALAVAYEKGAAATQEDDMANQIE